MGAWVYFVRFFRITDGFISGVVVGVLLALFGSLWVGFCGSLWVGFCGSLWVGSASFRVTVCYCPSYSTV